MTKLIKPKSPKFQSRDSVLWTFDTANEFHHKRGDANHFRGQINFVLAFPSRQRAGQYPPSKLATLLTFPPPSLTQMCHHCTGAAFSSLDTAIQIRTKFWGFVLVYLIARFDRSLTLLLRWGCRCFARFFSAVHCSRCMRLEQFNLQGIMTHELFHQFTEFR